MADLRDRGIGIFRLSPQSCDMVAIAEIYRDLLDGRLASAEAIDRTRALAGSVPFSDGFYRGGVGRTFAGSVARDMD